MKVLLTGHRGRLGAAIGAALRGAGHDVVGFDAADGDDVRDVPAVVAAAAGAHAIVHAAGLSDDHGGDPSAVMDINLVGTFNVLRAAREHGVRRVVTFSSGKALGMLERDPAYLPMDDDHPGLPSRPYGLSKWLADELCEAFTNETGIATICLRPVAVVAEPDYPAFAAALADRPADLPWHLGVFVDLDDVVEATLAALRCPDPGHVRPLLCGPDIASDRPTAELVAERLPDARWRDGHPYPAGSRAPLVDCSVARSVLGWEPRHGWKERAAALA